MIPDEKVKLTSMSPAAGCAAKIGPARWRGFCRVCLDLRTRTCWWGLRPRDDGAVYQISKDTALIQTLDFFPPMVVTPMCLDRWRRPML